MLIYGISENNNILDVIYLRFKAAALEQSVHLPLTVEPRLTANSVIRSPCYNGHYFWPPEKSTIHFFVKKRNSLIRSPLNTAKCFWPIGDRINGVPLYLRFLVKTTKKYKSNKINYR